MRTTCWPRARILVLLVVGLPGMANNPSLAIPSAASSRRTASPVGSSPTAPTRCGLPPRARTLAATFAAPPGTSRSPSTMTIGTGAPARGGPASVGEAGGRVLRRSTGYIPFALDDDDRHRRLRRNAFDVAEQ